MRISIRRDTQSESCESYTSWFSFKKKGRVSRTTTTTMIRHHCCVSLSRGGRRKGDGNNLLRFPPLLFGSNKQKRLSVTAENSRRRGGLLSFSDDHHHRKFNGPLSMQTDSTMQRYSLSDGLQMPLARARFFFFFFSGGGAVKLFLNTGQPSNKRVL